MPTYKPTVLARWRTHTQLRRLLPRMPFRYTVRFGTSGMTPNRVQINLPEAIANAANKKLMKECFDRAGVKTAPWKHAEKGDLRFPIVAKHIMGSRGTGVYRLTSESEYDSFVRGRTARGEASSFIYERFRAYSREYRLHVTEDGCFYTCRKVRTPECRERWKFSEGTVWLLESNPSFHKPSNWAEIEAECVKALKSCGLDFGACDVKVNKDGKFFILEINSAPGLEEHTLAAYREMLPRLATKKWEALRA